MQVAEVLIIREIDKIIRFSSNGNFSNFGNLDDAIISRSLDDIKAKSSINKGSLELIGTHLNDHILDKLINTL